MHEAFCKNALAFFFTAFPSKLAVISSPLSKPGEKSVHGHRDEMVPKADAALRSIQHAVNELFPASFKHALLIDFSSH